MYKYKKNCVYTGSVIYKNTEKLYPGVVFSPVDNRGAGCCVPGTLFHRHGHHSGSWWRTARCVCRLASTLPLDGGGGGGLIHTLCSLSPKKSSPACPWTLRRLGSLNAPQEVQLGPSALAPPSAGDSTTPRMILLAHLRSAAWHTSSMAPCHALDPSCLARATQLISVQVLCMPAKYLRPSI